MKLKSLLAIVALGLFAQSGVSAAPIVYTGTVTPNGPTAYGAAGPFGVFDPFGAPVNETFFQFFSFTVNLARPAQLAISVHRQDSNLDPFMSLYRGLITPGTDTSAFNPFGSFDAVTYIASADDELPAGGPFGDPQLVIFLPAGAATYTIAVGGAASDCPPSGCPALGFPFGIIVQVPEPSTIPLMLVAILGIGWILRRQGLAQASSPGTFHSA